ncbi:MAG: hypothetical protein U9N84_09610 [Actinomycetota bacterium]|nr:hypothetical protein [Actinomycetota bacterium]
MPFVWNKEVTNYKTDVFESSSLNYDRSIRLELADGDTVSVQFPPSAPADFVSIGNSFHTVQMDVHKYDEVYHMLQTEKPVFFTAYEAGSPAIRFAGFSTSQESVGEGLVDADA